MIEPTKKFNKLPAMDAEQAVQIISNSIIRRSYNYKPWWIIIVKPLIIIFKGPFYRVTIMNSK